ncbi:MAG: hypothetical protein AAGH64_09670, partial [Planctomycetota bacterium]
MAAQDTPGPADDPAPFEAYLQEASIGDLVRVEMRTGKGYEGTLVSRDGGEIVLLVERIEIRLEEDAVRRIVRLRSPAEQFASMREATGDRDEAGLLSLARWARDEGLLDESLATIGEVLEFNPTSREAIRMNRDVAFLLKLRQDAGERAPEEMGEDRRAAVEALRITNFPLLTDKQVNLIKVYEVDLVDPPRISVPRTTVNKLLDEFREDPLIPTTEEGRRAFRGLPDAEILDVMFRVQARKLYPEVRVTGAVESMQLFRDRVNA